VGYGVHVEGANEVPVDTLDELLDTLSAAEQMRAVGLTKANEISSRSHMLVIIRVTKDDTTGMLNLVDLAGNEKVKAS
jgi:hypothetical protein